MLKPLRELVAEADRFLGHAKTAAALPGYNEVSPPADTTKFAALIEGDLRCAAQSGFSPYEMQLIELNKLAAKAEIETLKQVAQFGGAAASAGYGDEQIEEVLAKVAAEKLHKHLGALVIASGLDLPGDDYNSLSRLKGKASVGNEKTNVPLTHSLRGAR